MTINPVLHSDTKPIAIDYHFLREKMRMALLLLDFFLQPCSWLIFSLSLCHVQFLMYLKPNLAFGMHPRQV